MAARVSVESRTLDLAFSEFYMAHYPLAWRHPDWPAGQWLNIADALVIESGRPVLILPRKALPAQKAARKPKGKR